LVLVRNEITEQGAEALLASPYLEHLHALYLAGNTFSTPMRRRLQERLGSRVVL
jgi:hypothetical protein